MSSVVVTLFFHVPVRRTTSATRECGGPGGSVASLAASPVVMLSAALNSAAAMSVLHLLLQIGVILLAGRLLGLAFRRLGQPSVIAEILAGILLGPSLLGAASPAALAALFPADTLPVLGTVSQLGLVFFMFLVGLEFDLGLLRGQGRTSLAISNAGIILPFALGAALSLVLYPTLAPAGVDTLPFGLFMGAAMSVTAFPVLARILAERRLIRTRIGAVALASAAVDDVTAWCLLAVVVAVASSTGLAAAAWTTGLAAVYVAFMWKVVRPMLARIGPRAGSAVSSDLVAGVFLLLLASAAMTEWIGIHALFGAFLFGVVVPRERGLAAILVEKLEDLVTLVLLPLFFAYSGLRTQIGLLDSVGAWQTAGVIVLVATLGKFGGTALAARLTGLDTRTSAAVGVLMNTRGLMELVVLNVGLDLKVISPELFAMMVVMALVTTLATSPVLERIFPAARMLEEEAGSVAEVVTPARPGLLLCISDPAMAASMVQLAEAWTRRGRAAVWALHLTPVQRMSDTMHPGPEPTLEPLQEALAAAEPLGLTLQPLSFSSADPGEDIVRIASLKRVPLIVVGGHRSALDEKATLGGATGGILRRSTMDVAVLLPRGGGPIRRIGRRGTDPAVERVVSRLLEEGAVLVDDRAEPVDLVVASPSARAEIAEEGGPSWLLVQAGGA